MASRYSTPVRLRRDFWAVYQHNAGVSLILGAPAILGSFILLNTGDIGPFGIAVVLVGFAFIAGALLSRTELTETELRSGLWPRRQVLDRSEISSVRPFTIEGGLYGPTRVIYVEVDGEEQVVRLSRKLGAKRQDEWVDSINSWCDSI